MMAVRRSLCGTALLVFAVASAASAQEEIRLWPNGAPGSEGKTAPERLVTRPGPPDGFRRVTGIHNPSLIAYLPSKQTATGAAVIVMPGGSHQYLVIDNEGEHLAKWLSQHGIAGFVLKYRLAREEGSTYTVEQHAFADAQRAIRVLRSRSGEWSIDPERIGVLGFSAGGQVAYQAATRFDSGSAEAPDAADRVSSRPAFMGLVYSGPPQGEPRPDMPPVFICLAVDDKGPARSSVELFGKLRDAGVSAELHVYATGGHGFGMKDRPLPITSWPTRFREWMADRGFLTHASSSR